MCNPGYLETSKTRSTLFIPMLEMLQLLTTPIAPPVNFNHRQPWGVCKGLCSFGRCQLPTEEDRGNSKDFSVDSPTSTNPPPSKIQSCFVCIEQFNAVDLPIRRKVLKQLPAYLWLWSQSPSLTSKANVCAEIQLLKSAPSSRQLSKSTSSIKLGAPTLTTASWILQIWAPLSQESAGSHHYCYTSSGEYEQGFL